MDIALYHAIHWELPVLLNDFFFQTEQQNGLLFVYFTRRENSKIP